MEYLTLDYIKSHSRVCCDCEDDLLDLYGEAAEQTIINLLGRTLDDLKAANNDEVPAPVIHATLLITESMYQHRAPTEQINLSVVPYGIDMMLKPYIVL
jgi:hypothetical protein